MNKDNPAFLNTYNPAKESPYLLHMFNPMKNVSPFDVNMAYEAEFDGVIPYADVTLDDIHGLTQDTIFSRGPIGVKRTGIFIGGRDFGLALDMLKRAKAAMVPPFEVSVFADPSGAVTTAAAIVAAVEAFTIERGAGDLKDKKMYVIGLGPVGVCAGILAANAGARVSLVSHLGMAVAEQVTDEYNRRYSVTMAGADGSSEAATLQCLQDADLLIAAAKAGIRVVTAHQLAQASRLLVAADVNAVPPSGIEGIGVHDKGKPIEATPLKALGLGALAIGNLKYQVHHRIFKKMITAERPLYIDHLVAFQVARELTAAE